MAYDEELADRIRTDLAARKKQITEKKMFGGIGFMLKGNLCVGVRGDGMIVRVPPDDTDALLRKPNVEVFDAGKGRAMKGWIVVAADGLRTSKQLRDWIDRGVAFAATLPPK